MEKFSELQVRTLHFTISHPNDHRSVTLSSWYLVLIWLKISLDEFSCCDKMNSLTDYSYRAAAPGQLLYILNTWYEESTYP